MVFNRDLERRVENLEESRSYKTDMRFNRDEIYNLRRKLAALEDYLGITYEEIPEQHKYTKKQSTSTGPE